MSEVPILGKTEPEDPSEDAARLLAEHEFQNISGKSSGGTEVLCPGTVTPIAGAAVTSHDLNAIILSSMGVFIVGTVNNREKDEVSRLIPWDNVASIDYNFGLLDQLLEKANTQLSAEMVEALKDANG